MTTGQLVQWISDHQFDPRAVPPRGQRSPDRAALPPLRQPVLPIGRRRRAVQRPRALEARLRKWPSGKCSSSTSATTASTNLDRPHRAGRGVSGASRVSGRSSSITSASCRPPRTWITATSTRAGSRSGVSATSPSTSSARATSPRPWPPSTICPSAATPSTKLRALSRALTRSRFSLVRA